MSLVTINISIDSRAGALPLRNSAMLLLKKLIYFCKIYSCLYRTRTKYTVSSSVCVYGCLGGWVNFVFSHENILRTNWWTVSTASF